MINREEIKCIIQSLDKMIGVGLIFTGISLSCLCLGIEGIMGVIGATLGGIFIGVGMGYFFPLKS